MAAGSKKQDTPVMPHCNRCKRMAKDWASLPDDARCNRMNGKGPKTARVMVVAEYPGAEECRRGVPYAGPGAKLLKGMLHEAGLSLADTRLELVVRCRPKRGRKPTPTEVGNCASYLRSRIRKWHPRAVVALGRTAWNAVTNNLGNVSRWEGRKVWSRRFRCWLVPLRHPTALLKTGSDWESDYAAKAIAEAVRTMGDPPPGMTTVVPHLVTSDIEVSGLVEAVKAAELVAVDTETHNTNPRSRLLGVSLAVNSFKGFYLPAHVVKRHRVALRKALERKDVAMHNCAFDMKVLARKGFRFQGRVWDTMLLHHLLDEAFMGGLKDLAWAFTGVGGYDDPLEDAKAAAKKVWAKDAKAAAKEGHDPPAAFGYGHIPSGVLAEYAAVDAAVTWELARVFTGRLRAEEPKALRLYEQIVMPARRVLNKMEMRGAPIDVAGFRKLDTKFAADLEYVEGVLRKMARRHGLEDWNIDADGQTADLLYGKLRLPPGRETKTRYSVDKDELERLKDRHPIPGLLQLHRKRQTYHSTFIRGILERQVGGRIHTRYLSNGTESGRLSSRDPNLQNIPRDRDIRMLFAAPEGRALVERDYSQMELRLIAQRSGDKKMLSVFAEGGDAHLGTAVVMFDKPAGKISKEERRIAKTLNFSIIYGSGMYQIAEQVGCTPDEAKEFRRKYFEEFSGIAAFLERTHRRIRKKRRLRSMFGRVRRLDKVGYDDDLIVRHVLREGANFLIQGPAAECTLIALARIDARLEKELPTAFPVLTVHDCIVCECDEGDAEAVSEIMREEMERPIEGVTVPLVADVEINRRWGHEQDSLGVVYADIEEEVQKVLSKFKRKRRKTA